jgi:hypothetical protein
MFTTAVLAGTGPTGARWPEAPEEGSMGYASRAFLACALILAPAVANATYHTYVIDELFSNADGTVQYVVLREALGMDGENLLAGKALTSTHGGFTKSYSFTRNLPGGGMCGPYGYDCMAPTAHTRVLIATDGFTALGLVTPDYVIPNGFLPVDGGTLNYAGVDQLAYAALPTDGLNALYRDGTTRKNHATNFAGDSAVVALAAVSYQGLWWAVGGTESGWGINFAHSGDQVFATWYTYDTTGKAWWLSMLANRTTTSSYSGSIYVDSGPPFNNFVGTGTPMPVGNGTLTFSDANNGTFAYSLNAGTGGSAMPVVQTKAIARYDLGTGAQPTCTYSATPLNYAAAANYQDLWWAANGTESGWGVNFAHQGNSVFATWYTYDVDGTPLWLSALMQRTGTSNVYAGSLLRTLGPRFDNYTTSDLKPAQNVGTATLTLASGNSATFNYVTNGTGGLPAVNQTKSIVRFAFTPMGGTVCQ